jgi:hypothetical protein
MLPPAPRNKAKLHLVPAQKEIRRTSIKILRKDKRQSAVTCHDQEELSSPVTIATATASLPPRIASDGLASESIQTAHGQHETAAQKHEKAHVWISIYIAHTVDGRQTSMV